MALDLINNLLQSHSLIVCEIYWTRFPTFKFKILSPITSKDIMLNENFYVPGTSSGRTAIGVDIFSSLCRPAPLYAATVT